MALLAQPKRKEKYGFDPRNTNWSNDDSKFGQKMMEKMGWEKGKGLGAKEDGMVDHIKASYKADTRGLGCTPKDADAWIAHQDDFNELLKKLNADSSSENASEKPKAKTESEEKPEGMKRFYGRFSRGRVQTLRTTEDIDCIMGRRKSGNSTPNTQSVVNSDDEGLEDTDKGGLKTITSECSVQEYFAQKMKELKARKQNSSNELESENITSSKDEGEEASKSDKTNATSVYSSVPFSYDNVNAAPTNADENRQSRGWYLSDEDTEKVAEVKESKKRKKKSKKRDVENYDDESSMKMKNKNKDCEEDKMCDEEIKSSEIEVCDKSEKKKKKKKDKEKDIDSDLINYEENFHVADKKDKKSRKRKRELEADCCDNNVESSNKKSKNMEQDEITEAENAEQNTTDRKKKKRKKEKKLLDEAEANDEDLERPTKSKKKSKRRRDESIETEEKVEDAECEEKEHVCESNALEDSTVDECNNARVNKKKSKKRSKQKSDTSQNEVSFPGSNINKVPGYDNLLRQLIKTKKSR